MTAAEHQNASQPPRIFYARHMQPGICKYDDETVLVDTPALKKMIATGAPIPVFIHHQSSDLKTMEDRAAGYVSESFYNELDGWAWFKFLAIDDECHLAVAKGWKVSNAYRGTQFGTGGTKNNCPYNREILDGKFTHLAIVPSPRYEDACIMSQDEFKAYQENLKRELAELQNSNPSPKGKAMIFKLFKNEKKEVTTLDADTMIELEGGQEISVGEMLNAVKKNADDEDKKKKEMENADQMVDCDGEKMPLKELVNKYNAMKKNNKKNKKNADGETEEEMKNRMEKENADAEMERKNAEEADKKKKEDEDEEKKNSKHFEELRNAHNVAVEKTPTIEAPQSQLARGKKRYGSAS